MQVNADAEDVLKRFMQRNPQKTNAVRKICEDKKYAFPHALRLISLDSLLASPCPRFDLEPSFVVSHQSMMLVSCRRTRMT
jgi:hypothetical protein